MKLTHTGKVAVGAAIVAVALTGCGAGADTPDGEPSALADGADALGGADVAAQLDELYAATWSS